MNILGKEVVTSDEESIGKVTEVDREYFTTFKKGLITDEEYRVPIDSISKNEPEMDAPVVKLLIGKEQLRHGYEFATQRPNSELVSGKNQSELTLPSAKPRIRYEALNSPESATTLPAEGRPSKDVEYTCDQCEAKFDDPDKLEEHRRGVHGGPVGI